MRLIQAAHVGPCLLDVINLRRMCLLQAVVFVRDLDRSVLGWGGHGLDHYLKLRAATDIVVNSILRVRRLLKQKRVANAGGASPFSLITKYLLPL